MTFRLNPSGHAQSFAAPLPISGTHDERRAALRNALKGALLPAAPTPAEPDAPSAANELGTVIGEVRETLGVEFDRVLPATEIKALEDNPAAAASFVKNIRTSRALARRDEVRAAVAAAQTAVDDHEKETSRLARLGLTVGAAERKARE